MVKRCRYHPDFRCSYSSCDVFDCNSGNVCCCDLHLNPFGRFTARKVGVHLHSIFNKHLKGRSLW